MKLTIHGYVVDFPFEPYASQKSLMSKVLTALSKQENALLESPTGSGKSLALLCSVLAWLARFKQEALEEENRKTAETAMLQELANGTANLESNDRQSVPLVFNSKSKRPKIKVPKIFFASRTHSQIAQIVRELQRTSYRPSMSILASRSHYCINSKALRNDNVNEECRSLVTDGACSYFYRASTLKDNESLRPGGKLEVWDVEDLVKLGRTVRGCPYFASREMTASAELIFCPYNYLLDTAVLRAMEIDISGAVVIVDEAHNVEDACRSAASSEVDLPGLHAAMGDLVRVARFDPTLYEPLLETVRSTMQWLMEASRLLEKKESGDEHRIWRDNGAAEELRTMQLSPAGRMSVLRSALERAGTIAHEAASRQKDDGGGSSASGSKDEQSRALTGMTINLLERLLIAVEFFHEAPHAYRLVVTKLEQPQGGHDPSDWTVRMCLWCLDPQVGFKHLRTQARSIILTSGTLAPLSSFASELGAPFQHRLEAPHVADPSQIWVGAIPQGVHGAIMDASFRNASSGSFLDALGETVLQCCSVVPDGMLVFFPSYGLLERVRHRWQDSGLHGRLTGVKNVFFEPRGGSASLFSNTLRRFRASVEGKQARGAVFFAVCRGKLSEGIDFTDRLARAVLVVGIPFPNTMDLQVKMKREYNDERCAAASARASSISGEDWYVLQAHRALNQATGRCIRHQYDFGAVLLLDQRYLRGNNVRGLSKWAQRSLKEHISFESAVASLQTFFHHWTTSPPCADTAGSSAALSQLQSQAPQQQQQQQQAGVDGVRDDHEEPAPDISEDEAPENVGALTKQTSILNYTFYQPFHQENGEPVKEESAGQEQDGCPNDASVGPSSSPIREIAATRLGMKRRRSPPRALEAFLNGKDGSSDSSQGGRSAERQAPPEEPHPIVLKPLPLTPNTPAVSLPPFPPVECGTDCTQENGETVPAEKDADAGSSHDSLASLVCSCGRTLVRLRSALCIALDLQLNCLADAVCKVPWEPLMSAQMDLMEEKGPFDASTSSRTAIWDCKDGLCFDPLKCVACGATLGIHVLAVSKAPLLQLVDSACFLAKHFSSETPRCATRNGGTRRRGRTRRRAAMLPRASQTNEIDDIEDFDEPLPPLE